MTGIVRPPKRCWPRCGRSPRMLPRPGPRGKPLARHREDPIQQKSAAFYPKEWRPPGIGCRATVFVGQREIAKNVKSPPALTHRLASHAGPKEHGQETGGTQMISFRLRILGQTLPFLLIAPLALAQTPASKGPSRAQATAALNQPANPGAAHYTRQQIDQLVAPIALYPDQLLSQVLMAATYPQQIAEAAQWLQDSNNAAVKGDALVAALEPLPWDPSVKSLVAFPQIITMLNEHIEWTQALGIAFASQQAEVMARVQPLRHLAMRSGKLKQARHLTVRQEGPQIVIVSAEPDKIYVPVYNPLVVYGEWP